MSYILKLRKTLGNQPLIYCGSRIVMERHDGHLLLIKRTDNLLWGLPAGGLELNESVETCIRREVLEETNLIVGELTVFGVASLPEYETYTYPNGDVIQNLSVAFYTTEWKGEAKADGMESSEVAFYDPNHLPEMNINESRTINYFLKYKKTGLFQLF